MTDFKKLRDEMVMAQLEARGIEDQKVLEAFRKVERHKLVPESRKKHAYDDKPLPIGGGQTISQPYMVASMTELLELEGDENVLEIGTGSGYQAAILSLLASKVISVERKEELAEEARERLEELGAENVEVVVGDGTKGYADEAPYDAIIVTAGAPDVPEPLKEQLKDGGRLVIPVGGRHGQKLLRIIRKNDGFIEEPQFGCVFVPLIGEFGW